MMNLQQKWLFTLGEELISILQIQEGFSLLNICVQGFFKPTTRSGMKWDKIFLLVLLFIGYCKGGRVTQLQSPLGIWKIYCSLNKGLFHPDIALCSLFMNERKRPWQPYITRDTMSWSCSFLRCEKRRFIKIKQHTESYFVFLQKSRGIYLILRSIVPRHLLIYCLTMIMNLLKSLKRYLVAKPYKQ